MNNSGIECANETSVVITPKAVITAIGWDKRRDKKVCII